MDPLCLALSVINHADALQILASTCRWLVTALRAAGMNTAERRVNLTEQATATSSAVTRCNMPNIRSVLRVCVCVCVCVCRAKLIKCICISYLKCC